MHRVNDVGNPWLDAGIVAFSTLVDPQTGKVSYINDKKYWQEWFPADFITESFPGQFKNWFYALIAMSTVLEDRPPFKNVLGFASVVGEDGRPMHKSWGNSIEFNEAADTIGVDAMRWTYLRQNPERNLLFGYKTVGEVKRQFLMILWNSYRFFVNFASLENWEPKTEETESTNILDKWILACLKQTVRDVTFRLGEGFDAFSATISLEQFVQDLSLWYIRRSRDRVGPNTADTLDKEACNQTLYTCFETVSRLLMPFTPFVSESIYTNLTGNESVNLADWPKAADLTEEEVDLLNKMDDVRKICELGHSQRKTLGIAVKQPLAEAKIKMPQSSLFSNQNLVQLIKDEINVENVSFVEGKDLDVVLDTNLTEDLVQKGKIREIIRAVQGARKEAGCRLDEVIGLELPEWPSKYEEEIKKKTLVSNITQGSELKIIRSS